MDKSLADAYLWAYTPTDGYKFYPPYLNLSIRGGRLHVIARGPEGSSAAGETVEFDLPIEALTEMQTALRATEAVPDVEAVARACADDADARMIAGKGDTVCFDEMDPETQEFWCCIARAALAAHPSSDTPAAKDRMAEAEKICRCWPLDQPEEEYALRIEVQEDGSGRFHCDECGLPMSPVGMSRADYLASIEGEGL